MADHAGAAKSEPKDGPSGQARGDEGKLNPKQASWEDLQKKIDELCTKGEEKAKAAGEVLAVKQALHRPGPARDETAYVTGSPCRTK